MAYTDTFTGSSSVSLSTYSANWEAVGYTELLRVNDHAGGSVAANQLSRHTGTYADKHYCEVVLGDAASGGAGPAIRMQSNGDCFYVFADLSTTAYPGQLISGSTSDWDVSGVTVPSGAKTLRLEIDATTATTVYFYVNGSLIKTYTGKSALSGGKAGLYMYDAGSWLDNFSAGDIGSGGGDVSLALPSTGGATTSTAARGTQTPNLSVSL